MATQDCVLFLTAGRSDVRITLQDRAGGRKAYEVAERSTAAFHGWLRERLADIEFPSSSGEQEDRRSRVEVSFEGGAVLFRDPESADASPLGLPDGKVLLQLPKLERVVSAVEDELAWRVLGAVVYYTDRQSVAKALKKHAEPFAVGELLQHWLRTRLALQIGTAGQYEPGNVARVNFAQGKATVEGRGRDYPIYRSIAALIESPLREASRLHPEATAVLSDMGGLPGMKPLMRAAAGVFFDSRVCHMADTERNPDSDRTGAGDEAVSAELSYQNRKLCLRLLGEGNFIGAWSASREVAHDHLGDAHWAAMLERLALFFDGRWRPASRASEAFPNRLLLSSGLNFCPRALSVALRAEAALRRGSLSEAMALACVFADAAMTDGISRFLTNRAIHDRDTNGLRSAALLEEDAGLHLVDSTLKVRGRVSDAVKDDIEKALSGFEPLKRFMKDDAGVKQWTIPAAEAGGDARFTEIERAWLEFIDREEFRTTGELKLPPLEAALTAYRQSLYSAPVGAASPHAVARRLAGGMPVERDLIMAANLFVAAGIWNRRGGTTSAGAEGRFSFAGPVVKETLTALGVREYEGLFERLVTQAQDYLRAYEMK